MQKKLIAIAVGATMVAAPMFAQADVKIKGKIQVELVSVDGGDQLDGTSTYDSRIRQGDYNGMSRWLIDASKDLGNGLKAIGRLAWQVNPSDGQDERARDQYVGLSGNWGAVVAGRLPTPYKMNGGVKWDPFVATFMQARQQGGMSGTALGHNSFVNDVIAYVMPELGGINATFAYVGSEDFNFGQAGADWDISGTYTAGGTGKWGPIEVMLAYTRTADPTTDDGVKLDKVKQAKAGIRYKGNGLTAAYQYEDVDYAGPVRAYGLSTGFNALGGSEIGSPWSGGTFNFFNLGYKFGNTLIAGNYGRFSGDTGIQDVNYGALGVKYYFDKKVSIHGGYATTDIKQNNSTGDVDGQGKYDIWGIGMRYDF